MKEAIVILLVMIVIDGSLIVSIRARILGWSMMRRFLARTYFVLVAIGSYAILTLFGVKAMAEAIVAALITMVAIVALAGFVEDDSGNWFNR